MAKAMKFKTYSELSQLLSFEERYQYLRLRGKVGEDTFGFDRYLNQEFYKTDEWRAIRDVVIIRDNGCDLGVDDRQIGGRILVHHMNPITKEDILYRSKILLDPEYLICTTDNTHSWIRQWHQCQHIPGGSKSCRNGRCGCSRCKTGTRRAFSIESGV